MNFQEGFEFWTLHWASISCLLTQSPHGNILNNKIVSIPKEVRINTVQHFRSELSLTIMNNKARNFF